MGGLDAIKKQLNVPAYRVHEEAPASKKKKLCEDVTAEETSPSQVSKSLLDDEETTCDL